MKVFITGVSDGVGKALAKQLVGAGHQVWGFARREELLKKLQLDFGKDKFFFTAGDVSNENDVERARKMMKAENFLPEAVVLNAAIFHRDTDPQFQHSLFKEAVSVNVFGSLVWVEKFIPDFLKRGLGSFIAISSVSAYLPDRNSISYPASKAALSMAFRSLGSRYQKDNIDFSVVHFGPIATSFVPQWTDLFGKPKYFFVLTPEKAAAHIKMIIESENKKAVYWPPFFISWLFRLVLFLRTASYLFYGK